MNAVLLALAISGGVEEVAKPRQFHVTVVIREGDPLGSRAEGNVKHLAEPVVVTQNGRPACFRAGSPAAAPSSTSGITGPGVQLGATGVELDVMPVALANGTVRLELRGTRAKPTPARVGVGDSEIAQQSARAARIAEFNKPLRFRIAAESPESQTWAEITVTEVKAK